MMEKKLNGLDYVDFGLLLFSVVLFLYYTFSFLVFRQLFALTSFFWLVVVSLIVLRYNVSSPYKKAIIVGYIWGLVLSYSQSVSSNLARHIPWIFSGKLKMVYISSDMLLVFAMMPLNILFFFQGGFEPPMAFMIFFRYVTAIVVALVFAFVTQFAVMKIQNVKKKK